jgi:hypothetical protein
MYYAWRRRGMHTRKVLVGRPEGKRPPRRPRRRWEDNTKMDLREIGCGDMDLIYLTQNRDQWRALVSTVMDLGGSIICWEIREYLSE